MPNEIKKIKKMIKIKDYEDYSVTEDGKVFSHIKSIYKKFSKHRQGYYMVGLTKNGKEKKCLVHRLVAEAYVKNPNKYKYVNHKDGNKNNNISSNLEWVTSSENQKHAYKLGLKIPSTKTKNNIIVLDLQTGIYYNSIKEASKIVNLSKGVLANMLRGCTKNKTSLIYAR